MNSIFLLNQLKKTVRLCLALVENHPINQLEREADLPKKNTNATTQNLYSQDTIPMSPIIRWGILGCGGIADKFVKSLRDISDSTLVAVASRTPGKAHASARQWNVPHAFTSYEELLSRTDIDAVYVATTHNFHYESVLAALQHDKAVLCEKPFTVNAHQAQILVNLARSKKLFMMEAMWTRFLSAKAQVRSWLAEGAIGTIRQVRADFGFSTQFNAESRLFNAALAGGALLDVGIYPISFASMVMQGQPQTIAATALIGKTGVDEHSAYLFGYPGGSIALLSSAIVATLNNNAQIIGTEGRIELPVNFYAAESATLIRGKKRITKKFPCKPNSSFRYEIQEVVSCLQQGKTESELLPLSETLAIMQTMDTIREKLQVRYAGDTQ